MKITLILRCLDLWELYMTNNMSFSIVCMSIRKMYFNAQPPHMCQRWACKKSGDIYIKQVLCRLIWSDRRAWVWQSLSHHATLVTAPKVCQIQNYFCNSTVWGSLDHTFQIWRLGPGKSAKFLIWIRGDSCLLSQLSTFWQAYIPYVLGGGRGSLTNVHFLTYVEL